MSNLISDEQIATLSECIFQGRKIEAIKLYRGMTGAGLKEAKDAVEELERSLRVSSADKFAAGAQAKGCLGVVVFAMAGAAGLVTYWLA